jgi:hypothetical protein
MEISHGKKVGEDPICHQSSLPGAYSGDLSRLIVDVLEY